MRRELRPTPFRTQPLSKRATGCNSNLVLPTPFHISAANLQQNSRKGCGLGAISALVDDRVSHAKWAILRMAVAAGVVVLVSPMFNAEAKTTTGLAAGTGCQ
jgi:hypothetical protein